MFALFFCFLYLQSVQSDVQFQYNTPPESVLTTDGGNRINGVQDRRGKDIILGGLFTVHRDAEGSAGGKCGSRVWGYGMDTLEAMFYALDSINSDPNLLPNITLGYDIRDTCQSDNIALDESVKLVFINTDAESGSCRPLEASGNDSIQIPVAATIGPLESFISIPVASFFRLFQMPQVSYGSTSTELNNRDQYEYFFRTIPAHDSQAQAMIDIMSHYEWDHVSVVYSNNLFGDSFNHHFLLVAKANKICIDADEPIRDDFAASDYRELAQQLFLNTTANVIVLLATSDHADNFIKYAQIVKESNRVNRNFVWIACTGSAEAATEFTGDIIAGMWGVFPISEPALNFQNYKSNLTASNNMRNPWYKSYYEELIKCTDEAYCTNNSVTATVPNVIDAVYSLAYAIQTFIQDNCQQPVVWFANNQTCEGMKQAFSGQNLRHYLKSVNFTSLTGNNISFNENGDIESRYKMINFQVSNESTTYKLTTIFYWDEQTGLHKYSNETAQFGHDQESGSILYQFKSQCKACNIGYVKRKVISSCCGSCDPCLGRNYTNNTLSTTCDVCPDSMWGNDPLHGSSTCVHVQESFLHITDPWAITLMILAIIGLISVAIVTGTFICYWNRPIIKSSGREQMILILIGITLCFVITVIYLIKPSIVVCTLQRAGLWFCFSIMLSALFVKLVRISRIFMQKTVSKRPKFISPKYQILFTFILVGIQMILVLISLIVSYPTVKRSIVNNEENQNDFPSLVVQCSSPHTAMIAILMVYYSILLIASNALAILTIRFPQNFNESKYVAFSTFSLGLMWIAFIFTYLNTADKFQTAVISFTIQMSAMSVLLCLFAPRVFIVLFLSKRKVNDADNRKSTMTGEDYKMKPKVLISSSTQETVTNNN